jgi:antitoxin YefM
MSCARPGVKERKGVRSSSSRTQYFQARFDELVAVTGGEPADVVGSSAIRYRGQHRMAIIVAMETTSLADAKNRLSELVAAVHGTWERVTITKNGKPVAVLISVEDLESLTETLEILSDPDAMAAIAEDRSGTTELTTGQEMAAIMAKRFGRV